MPKFSSVIIGNESLAIQCGEMLVAAGHRITAVVTRNSDVAAWAANHGLAVHKNGSDLAEKLSGADFDWLLSIANLDLIPDAVLALPKRGAVNFHDGLLPAYAGLNAPVWARLAGETTHGITWHYIEGGIDEGRIIAQAHFDVSAEDTALTLNTKCYGAAIDSFAQVITELASDTPKAEAQDLSQRSYFARDARPAAAGRIDPAQNADQIIALVRALDHGDYWNPLACPKIATANGLFLVGSAEISDSPSDAAPGTVLAADTDSLTIATGSDPVVLGRIRDAFGTKLDAPAAAKGANLPALNADEAAALSDAMDDLASSDPYWRKKLEANGTADLPFAPGAPGTGQRDLSLPTSTNAQTAGAALVWLMGQLSDSAETPVALARATDLPGYICDWVPAILPTGTDQAETAAALAKAMSDTKPAMAADLLARIPGGANIPAIGLSDQGMIQGTALTLVTGAKPQLLADTVRISDAYLGLMSDRLIHILSNPDAGILPPSEAALMQGWNDTGADYDADLCIHQAFEAQVVTTPDAPALAFEGQTLGYGELNAAANRVAHRLIGMGVAPGTIVGLHLPRSVDLLVGALGIMKAGGAYLPMDPAYPADRTALFIEDSKASVIVTNESLAKGLPTGTTALNLDQDPEITSQPDTNPASGVKGSDLAYMIYTSGSTGRPKGVMVEHRNVSNFFVGMDARIAHEPGAVFMAVTSLSFDISVLELFWTLARGFKLVLSGDESRALVSGESTGRHIGGMEFSLYYWGNDDGKGRGKYRTLLEGAKFGDENGFCAVWTPERHFHAFGGPYPNPSVTGAAVASITQNIGVRAGSCVAPLHHTARIAEEWAVIDNLTEGRAGLAIASGWQPDDFVLRPENTPPDNKPAMFEAIRDLRKLWAGEAVEFPRKDGKMHAVVTQPRPISDKPALWVTTAGNPATWKEAGENGCNVLTHLLGQSIDEVADKIKIYKQALADAGHNPDDFTVTLMLHSFLADTRDQAREIAREPMKDYLRAAAGLIKQYAWAFPAFKRPKGVDNAFQLDLGSLTEEELEGILDFAFERYFNDSGLFGTVEDALERVEQVKAIGVTEIACLIDYGIEVDTVLEGLKPLAEVLRLSNIDIEPAEGDFSIAAQIARHKVTHLQCTPSMAQMLVMNDEARASLKHLDVMMVGGEPLPGALASELASLTGGHIENMYGPTETTIWSTTHKATGGTGVTPVGTPIANTSIYVLDEAMNPVPIGVAGELYIGGAGVTRGYFERPELTAERFLSDPIAGGSARMYRTGDLVRFTPDGTLDFLGRADFQVKLRGYRIELGEIESVIDQIDGIRQSVVMAREDTPGLTQLVAYLIADGAVDDKALRSQLAGALPAHMVPSAFVTLDAFPLTPNKKVDRKALPAPQMRPTTAPAPKPAAETATQAPAGVARSSDEIRTEIATIWSAILGVGDVSARDNFFELGGHSLLAVQAHREIRNALGATKLSITDIFGNPTLGGLTDVVAKKLGGSAPKAPKTPASEPVSTPAVATGDAPAAANETLAKRRAMRAARRARSA